MSISRLLYLVGGWTFAGLAFLGALLPLMPTTPFLLLAGICFARSSPRMHERLMSLPMFGEYMRQWNDSHTVPRAAKRRAWILILVSFSISVYLANSVGLRIALGTLGLLILVAVALLPQKNLDEIPGAEPGSRGIDAELEACQSSDRSDESTANPLDQGAEGAPQTSDPDSEKLARLSER
ncbi:MAG: uncharacterized membrane protein YbaN (DUF454 family) [Planctomycetota bacterium]|jgi:uncharacterized membrane protein YbaN (DUF454 family)